CFICVKRDKIIVCLAEISTGWIREPWRNESMCCFLLIFCYKFNDILLINSQRKSLAYLFILEWFFIHIKSVKIKPCLIFNRNIIPINQLLRQIGWNVRHIKLTILKHLILCVCILDHCPVNFI